MLRWKSSLKPAAAAAADYRSTILADSPLFYYRLGESSGSNAYDEVAASNNGTYYNTPTLGQTGAISGDSNTSVKFNEASSEYAEALTLSSETSLFPCTIECFMKTDGASDTNAGIVFYRSGSNTASGLNMYGASTSVRRLGYHWRDQSDTWGFSTGPTLSDNTWYYVALVVESTKATFYVIEEDGTLTTAVNSVSHSALDISDDGWHFARDSSYTRYFQGWLDEIAIYDQALSQSTVVAHAAAAGFTSSGTTYLFDESFEGTGTPTGFTNSISGSGTIDYDHTTNVLEGSKSLHVYSDSDTYAYLDLGLEYDHIVAVFGYYNVSVSNRTDVAFCDGDLSRNAYNSLKYGSVSSFDKGINHDFGAVLLTLTGTINTFHYVRVELDVSGGVVKIARSNDKTSFPTSGTNYAEDLTAAFDSRYGGTRYILFGFQNSTKNSYYDDIEVIEG